MDGASTDRAIGAGQNWADPAFMRGLNQGAVAGAVFNAVGAAAIFGAGGATPSLFATGILTRLTSSPAALVRWLGLVATASSQVVKGCADAEAGISGAAAGARPFAMGLTDEGLEAFAQARGAATWKDLPDPANWKAGVLEKLANPMTQVHFNLDGVNAWQGVSRAAAGRGGPTDWELLTIQQNPQFWERIQFWRGGAPAPNPFQ